MRMELCPRLYSKPSHSDQTTRQTKMKTQRKNGMEFHIPTLKQKQKVTRLALMFRSLLRQPKKIAVLWRSSVAKFHSEHLGQRLCHEASATHCWHRLRVPTDTLHRLRPEVSPM